MTKAKLEKQIQELAVPDGAPEGTILTGWVLVAEWYDALDGDKWVTTATGEATTPWLANGLLDEARRSQHRAMDEAGS